MVTEISTYVDEMFVKFVIGKEPLSNFDAYLQRLKQMKLDDAVQIEQNALDRYNKRK